MQLFVYTIRSRFPAVFRIRIGLDPLAVKMFYFWSSKTRIRIRPYSPKSLDMVSVVMDPQQHCLPDQKTNEAEPVLLRICCSCYELWNYFFCFSSPSTLCEYSQDSGQAHLLPRNPQKNCFKSGKSSLYDTVPVGTGYQLLYRIRGVPYLSCRNQEWCRWGKTLTCKN